MVAGYLPFFHSDPMQNLHNICNTPLKYPLSFSPQLIDLRNKLLCKDPKKRISIDEIMKHPWFSLREYEIITAAIATIYRQFTEMNCDDFHCTQSDIVQAIALSENHELAVLYQRYLCEARNNKMATVMEEMREHGLPRLRPACESQIKAPTVAVQRQAHSDRSAIPGLLRLISDDLAGDRCDTPPITRIILGQPVAKT
jgi:hypothetical protein